jgi:hypothetical protein
MCSAKGMSTLVRPKFGPGMLLQHEDLEQLADYTRELSRLLFRSFFGCGVVCGLKVEYDRVCGKPGVKVSPGLALDCTGDPVYVPSPKSLTLVGGDCPDEISGPLWVILCHTPKCCSPRPSACPSGDDETPPVCTRERDAFEIQIVGESELPQCLCGCRQNYDTEYEDYDCKCADPTLPCYQRHYDGECGCSAAEEGSDCCGNCVVLALLTKRDSNDKSELWDVDHRVRRFIRPVLMRDPLLEDYPHQDPPPPPPPPPPAPPPSTTPAGGEGTETPPASTESTTAEPAPGSARASRKKTQPGIPT